jgi:hypothetical protein
VSVVRRVIEPAHERPAPSGGSLFQLRSEIRMGLAPGAYANGLESYSVAIDPKAPCDSPPGPAAK